MTSKYYTDLQDELFRVVARVSVYNTFTAKDGSALQGATETDVIKHLTSRTDYVSGRQHTFPGIASGWRFPESIKAAGFTIVEAKNYRGQLCRVVTIA